MTGESILAGRARQVQLKAESLKIAEAQQSQQEQLSSRADELQTKVQGLRAALGAWHQVLGLGLTIPENVHIRASKVLGLVRDLQARFLENPDVLMDNAFRGVMDAVTGLKTLAEEEFRRAWQQHLDLLLPDWPDVVLDVLASQPSQALHVQRARSGMARIRQLRTRYPVTVADLATLKAAKEDLDRAAKGLQASAVPQEVLAFLLATAGGGAPLPLLTPAVTDWLREHQVSHAFRVTRNTA